MSASSAFSRGSGFFGAGLVEEITRKLLDIFRNTGELKGADGKDGNNGHDGVNGADGQSIVGAQGPIGLTGATGATGATGGQGAQGIAGISTKIINGLSVSNDNTEKSLFVYTVPANALGTNNAIRFTVYGRALQNNSTQTYRFRTYYGGVELWQDLTNSMPADAVYRVIRFEFILRAKGLTNAQAVYGFGIGSIGSANTGLGNVGTDEIDFSGAIISIDGAINSTIDNDFKLTVAMSSASVNQNISIDAVIIETIAGG